MGYKTWTTGEVISASNLNAEVRDQVISTFASESARNSAISLVTVGQHAVTTDTGTLWQRDSGGNWRQVATIGAWTSWTPSIFQGVAVSFTNTSSRFVRIGRTIIGQASCAITSAGSSGSALEVSIPVAAVTTGNPVVGTLLYFDSGTAYYHAAAAIFTSTSVRFYAHNVGVPVGQAPAFGAASGDGFQFQFQYEAA